MSKYTIFFRIKWYKFNIVWKYIENYYDMKRNYASWKNKPNLIKRYTANFISHQHATKLQAKWMFFIAVIAEQTYRK